MTYLRHRYTVAFVTLLLAVICLQSSGALLVQVRDGATGRNVPTCHCCHAKVFLKLDWRVDLKPVFLLPSRIICPGDMPMKRTYCSFHFSCTLPARSITAARLRGPPVLPTSC
jgi:hypothetical protein